MRLNVVLFVLLVEITLFQLSLLEQAVYVTIFGGVSSEVKKIEFGSRPLHVFFDFFPEFLIFEVGVPGAVFIQ